MVLLVISLPALQREGVKFALRRGGRVLIGDEMGLVGAVLPLVSLRGRMTVQSVNCERLSYPASFFCRHAGQDGAGNRGGSCLPR